MLLKNENEIIRVLQTKGDKSLVIDCIKRTMPKWIATTDIASWVKCSEVDLYELTGMTQDRQLTEEEKRIAQERFTMIAGVLPFIGNEPKRNQMLQLLSEHQSKQTIRKYLCLYLVYQNITALAPMPKTEKVDLTQDEKNIRWALNKFFYITVLMYVAAAGFLHHVSDACSPPDFCGNATHPRLPPQTVPFLWM